MMKGNFKRLLAFLLMLGVLVSMLSVFAVATDGDDTATEEEAEETITMYLNRTFDEGWDLTNGFSVSLANVPGANFFVDNETGFDYTKNYFARLEFGDRSQLNKDHYMSVGISEFDSYVVLQYDIKVDDAFSYSNRVCYSQIKSSTGQNNILSLNKDNISVFNQVICDTSVEWVTLTYVFDYTLGTKGETNGGMYQYGTCVVTATDQEGNELGKVEANEVWTLNTMRFGSHHAASTVRGESFCLDNFRLYSTSTGRVLSAEEANELGYGSKVNESKAPTVSIDKGDGNTTGAEIDPYATSIAFKVGVEYCLEGGETRAPIFESENGDVYGSPVVHNGKIYVPVQTLLDMLGYEYYIHSSGLAYDVSSGLSATSIYAGRTSAVADGKNVYLTAAPEYITEKVNGNSYEFLAVCIDDIETLFPGVYMDYDTMGFIFVSRTQNLLDTENDMATLLNLMKKFIYPEVTSESVRDLVAQNTKAENGEELKHPYIYANQEEFDRLATAYTLSTDDENYDPYLAKGIQSYINSANNVLKVWADSVETGDAGWEEAYQNYISNGIGVYLPEKGIIYLPYLTAKPGNNNDMNHVGRRNSSGNIITQEVADKALNNGYDTAGGRLSGSDSIGDKATNLAFAYQITGNITYAMVAYELLTGIAEWDHWGPGHFLNCADTAQRYAVTYDWLYNAFVELETSADAGIAAYREKNEYNYSKQVVADGLYWNGLYAGYSTMINKVLPPNRVHPELTTGQIIPGTTHGSTGWANATQNWNCVCNCGILLSCLALLNETDTERVANIDTMIEICFNGLVTYGLDCYAPDGSYPEGAGYWQYGTLQFFKIIAAFKSACGTDFNLLDAPGIDKTCYYAIHVCSSDSIRFGYHDDGGSGYLDSTWYIMVGESLGDEGIIQLRMNKIRQGTTLAYGDLFYWNADYLDSEYVLPKSYFMEGIDTFVVRDGWESGSLFTGLHGGKNLVNHGNIDAGTFIYVNDKIAWFCELGSENYNVGGYFSTATRYQFYRCNTEGQNTICLTGDQANIKYGQRSDATATTVAFGENEHGAYHILDMTDCYFTNTNYGYRGILVTNDFKTTVIRDDIQFRKFNSLYWFGHTKQQIEIDEGGKVAYLTYTDSKTERTECVRVTLVSTSNSYRFIEMTAYDTVLDVTLRKGENNKEYSRSEYKKLAITTENALTFNAAVVIEMVDSKTSKVPCGYTLEDFKLGMYDHENQQVLWEPYGEQRVVDNTNSNTDSLIIKPSNPTNIELNEGKVNSNIIYIDVLGSDRYGYEIEQYYDKLVEIEYICAFIPSLQGSSVYAQCQVYRQEFNEFAKAMNVEFVNLSEISKSMLGF